MHLFSLIKKFLAIPNPLVTTKPHCIATNAHVVVSVAHTIQIKLAVMNKTNPHLDVRFDIARKKEPVREMAQAIHCQHSSQYIKLSDLIR